MATLISWLGTTDVEQMKQDKQAALASIALKSPSAFDRIIILANHFQEDWSLYEKWLKKRLATLGRPNQNVAIYKVSINSPIHYESIARVTQQQLHKALEEDSDLTFNLTSGTPAMSTLAVLLGKSTGQCRFIQSSPDGKVEDVEIPIDFASEYKSSSFQVIHQASANKPALKGAFEHITANSPAMKEAIYRSQQLAPTDVPTLILGETGTGKEVMANAIHAASPRENRTFKAVNCGALPENLVDSILFGHVKGAFTGADKNHDGLFVQADGGTLFLDEVGELPLNVQVKLLRALQQREVTPVGSTKAQMVDVRIIAATHRDLFSMVSDGTFREDLFYRLAVGIIDLPPLRERHDDIEPLIASLWEEVQQQLQTHPDTNSKKISKDAIKFAKEYSWPGNIRELWSTLHRAALWSINDNITAQDLQSSVLIRPKSKNRDQRSSQLSLPCDIVEHVENIKKSALESAIKRAGGNKTKAAKLLGLKNHQTFSNWMDKVGLVLPPELI